MARAARKDRRRLIGWGIAILGINAGSLVAGWLGFFPWLLFAPSAMALHVVITDRRAAHYVRQMRASNIDPTPDDIARRRAVDRMRRKALIEPIILNTAVNTALFFVARGAASIF